MVIFGKPNNIRIRPFLGNRIIFVFVFGHQNTIRSPLVCHRIFREYTQTSRYILTQAFVSSFYRNAKISSIAELSCFAWSLRIGITRFLLKPTELEPRQLILQSHSVPLHSQNGSRQGTSPRYQNRYLDLFVCICQLIQFSTNSEAAMLFKWINIRVE